MYIIYIIYIFRIYIFLYVFYIYIYFFYFSPLWSLHPFSHRERSLPGLQILQGTRQARCTNKPSYRHQRVWETHIFWRFHIQEADSYKRTLVCSFPAMPCKEKGSCRSPFWESLMVLSASCDKWLICVPEKMSFHLQWAGSWIPPADLHTRKVWKLLQVPLFWKLKQQRIWLYSAPFRWWDFQVIF